MKRWYVLRVAGEYRTLKRLQRADVDAWLPECEVVKRYRKAGRMIKSTAKVPVFPTYLFISDEREWPDLHEIEGVISIVSFNGKPAQLPPAWVAQLQRRIEADGGLLKIDEDKPLGSLYVKGQQLRVTEGPFGGLTGLYDGEAKGRVALLLDILGGTRVVEIPEALVEPA